MNIYNKVYKVVESKHDEKIWEQNCQSVYQLYLELESQMIDIFVQKLRQLHDYAFLEYFDKFWSSVRLYTKWNLTIFASVESYVKLYERKTLV